MKLWIDDVRPALEGYTWCKSTNEAINQIKIATNNNIDIELIDIDHDAGSYASDGGDYIRVLYFMEFYMLNVPIHIHSTHQVGAANMRRIIQKNGWKEV